MPEWVRQLDETTIRSIAKRHLACELPSPLDDGSLDLKFFTEGAHNKLYLISYANHHTEYLFRVSLPVEPYFKTESEVATLAFLRSKTSIPVARVIAWDSDFDNELGFEWLLMERIRGVTLQSVWREMSWREKTMLTTELAGIIKRLRDIKFDRIGSLYFKSAFEKEPGMPNARGYGQEGFPSRAWEKKDTRDLEPSTPPPMDHSVQTLDTDGLIDEQESQAQAVVGSGKTTTESETHNDENSTSKKPAVGMARRARHPKRTDYDSLGGFTVGPLFDRIFYMDDRVYLPGDRGPYGSSEGMLRAEVNMQLEWIKNGRSIMHSKELLSEAGYCEDDFEQEAPTMEILSHTFLKILPHICEHEKPEQRFILQHHDLHASNILVDPTSYRITGIVDWEMTCVVPTWMASTHPVFLQDIDPFIGDEAEPPIPSYEHEHDDKVAIMKRDRWESKKLRDHFDRTIQSLIADDDVSAAEDDWEAETKRNFKLYAWELTENTKWAGDWLREIMLALEDWSLRRGRTCRRLIVES